MKADILSMTEDELLELVISINEEKYRAAQLYKWLHSGTPIDEMSNIPKKMREKLVNQAEIRSLQIEEKHVSTDGTIKYLLKCIDGELIESVFMRHNYGNTVCVSSQAGCRMGCRFCASTINGLSRNLTASEMLSQILTAQRNTGERISNVVIMGSGEPFDNYDNVVRFIRLANSENGLNISCRRISLSTCGVVPGIEKFAREGLPVTLSVSLHAVTDEKRSAIMPINNKYPIAELLAACREYYSVSNRRISFEYALIDGQNNTPADAQALAKLLRSKLSDSIIHVNLIPVNDVAERDFKRGARTKTDEFVKVLESFGVNVTVRRSVGGDINASCGQLRARRAAEQKNEEIE